MFFFDLCYRIYFLNPGHVNNANATLVLVCKRPILGNGKQRLAQKLGGALALQIAEALLACAVEDACAWPGPVAIAPAVVTDADWAAHLLDTARLRYPAVIVPQAPGNLGQRLNALDRALRAQGLVQLVFIGSDAPGLDAEDYHAVRAALQYAGTVLIPARDGGVVLMASRYPWPELSLLPWSSAQLGKSLRKACQSAGQSVSMVRQGYDIDEAADLIAAADALRHDERPARRALRALILANLSAIEAEDG